MPLRYRTLASYGVKSMEWRFRVRAQTYPKPLQLRGLSTRTWSNRHLHTTLSLNAPATSLLQDDDDADVEKFAQSRLEEIVAKATSSYSLKDEVGRSSIWDKSWGELLEPSEPIQQKPKSSKVLHDALSGFDPERPPTSLEELQLWLECEAQQESVLKYQSVIDSARERADFSVLSLVQRQVLEWYQPLKQAIEREQSLFMSGTNKRKGMNSYGPHLCSLPAEKIAVMLAHETILHCLAKNDRSESGATLASTARRLGEVVEAEVNVHKILLRRMREQQMGTDDNDDFGEALADFVKDEALNLSDDIASTACIENDVEEYEDQEEEDLREWMYSVHHRQLFTQEISKSSNKNSRIRVQYANRRALKLLETEREWTASQQVQLGAALLEILLEEAKIRRSDGKIENAFTYHKAWRDNKLVGWILLHDDIYKMAMEDRFGSTAALSTRHKPMVIPPNPWVSPREGGYKWLQVEIMRTHGSKMQREAIRSADLSTAFDGLNVLGQVPWKINKPILDVAQQCWLSGVVIGDIPSRNDLDVPPAPLRPEKIPEELFQDTSSEAYRGQVEEFKAYTTAMNKHRRVKQKNLDLRSLRCSALLKLDQAEKFKDFEQIYFPYNMDFRGRAYPIPPHLSNVGSDLCRGMLTFANAKKLGPRGLYWLKVHLANLAGNDKITFDERADFTEQNMENVRAAVEDPFGENRWWMTLDDPFQGLAVCHEIVKAVDSGDPESYECSLPVHMDGSCNGLQHYAALGRDSVGGKAVNLCKEDRPQDVYSGVMLEVIRQVAREAATDLDFDESNENLTKSERDLLNRNRSAKLVNGLIDRGVVKRTVMTSVYGVTYVGARKQIQEKIEEKLEEKGMDVDSMMHEIQPACGYLATVTMEVMGQLFSGARQTMNWLTACAKLIAKQGQPVAFISPIGVPVVQPYRQSKPHTVVTLLQTVVLVDNADDLPLHRQRQVSAFPPNYVHSLDSSHMLLTALEMDRRGLHFSAVHDSFWTHPCDVDEMNEALRDCFIALYQQPLLEDLKKSWETRYPSIHFPDLPARGDLDLNDVREAPYFFQ